MIRILNFNVAFNDKSSLQELAAKRLNLAPQNIREVLTQEYLVEWNIRSTFASAFENTATVVV